MDAHLLAEFSALKRVVKLAKKSLSENKTVEGCKIPSEYCLGVGHFLFFQDKIRWVRDRILKDFEEIESRNYVSHPQEVEALLKEIDSTFTETEWYKDFDPSYDELYLSMARAVTSVNAHKINNELIESSHKNAWLKERRVPVLRDRISEQSSI
jgi:deoxyribonuclease (pyrimidine dimer)